MNLNQATLPATGFERTAARCRGIGLWCVARPVGRSGNVICLFRAGDNGRNPPWRVAD